MNVKNKFFLKLKKNYILFLFESLLKEKIMNKINKIQKNPFNKFTYILLIVLLYINVVKSEDQYEQLRKYQPFIIAAIITSLIILVGLCLACFSRVWNRLKLSRDPSFC